MKRLSGVLAGAALLGAGTAFAGAFGNLMRAELALKQATAWHLTEQMPGGKTLVMDYSAPDRWRIEPAPTITEVIIGTDVYMVTAGRVMKLPPTYGAMIARTVHIHMFVGAERAAVRRSVRALGTQTLDGQPVHVYRYVLNGTTETWYVNGKNLPMRAVIHDSKGTRVVQYSRFDVPITIQPPGA